MDLKDGNTDTGNMRLMLAKVPKFEDVHLITSIYFPKAKLVHASPNSSKYCFVEVSPAPRI